MLKKTVSLPLPSSMAGALPLKTEQCYWKERANIPFFLTSEALGLPNGGVGDQHLRHLLPWSTPEWQPGVLGPFPIELTPCSAPLWFPGPSRK